MKIFMTALISFFMLSVAAAAAPYSCTNGHSMGWGCSGDSVTSRDFARSASPEVDDVDDEDGSDDNNNDDGNNGHGNDDGGVDPSNPGKSKGSKGKGKGRK